MNKFKSIIAAVLCFILVIASIPTSASASSEYLPMMPVEKLNNKYVFSMLRTSVSSSVNSRNYSRNKANNNINLFVYNQKNVNMMVGESKFSDVGCEIAACFNATVELTDYSSRAKRKGLLPIYIDTAELNKYTMSLNSVNGRVLAEYLLNTYFNTYSVNIVRTALHLLTSTIGREVVYQAVLAGLVSKSGFGNSASFGTDPYMIPSLLNKVGAIKVSNTFNTYKSMNEAVSANLHYSKPKKVYIVSYWNQPTLNDCFDEEEGFHTVCFYTSGGTIYSYNNGKSSTGAGVEASFERLIKNQKRFIVGYCVTLK